MTLRKNLSGLVFSRLTIVGDADNYRSTSGKVIRMVRCSCTCGNSNFVVRVASLKNGCTKSCGCLSKEQDANRKKHNLKKSEPRLHNIWRGIRSRCHNENDPAYLSYGGAGIGMQQSWLENSDDFIAYVKSLPGMSTEKSIDRIDNDLGYSEGNIRWATDATQNRNKGLNSNNTSGKCGVVWWVSAEGVTKAVAQWRGLDGKESRKYFSARDHGVLPAFRLAALYRDKKILELNSQGADYSLKHGQLRSTTKKDTQCMTP